MAHIRRKFVDVQQSQGSAIAEEAIKRIAKLYAVEKEVRVTELGALGLAGGPRGVEDDGGVLGRRRMESVDGSRRGEAAECVLTDLARSEDHGRR